MRAQHMMEYACGLVPGTTEYAHRRDIVAMSGGPTCRIAKGAECAVRRATIPTEPASY